MYKCIVGGGHIWYNLEKKKDVILCVLNLNFFRNL